MTSASSKAYQVAALIRTCQFALENETCGVPYEQRGIDTSLEIAVALADDLIDLCEEMERHKLKNDKPQKEDA